ncbi:MAG: hypothetical protein VB115_15140 [Christensenellaceae bacterium]|nr:hypothetical protein [Christensenellaceae bacterium]
MTQQTVDFMLKSFRQTYGRCQCLKTEIEQSEGDDARLQALHRELEEKQFDLQFVSAWMSGLNEKERWLIEQHVIGGLSWRDIVCLHKEKYGREYAKDTLRALKRKALAKIYQMAA